MEAWTPDNAPGNDSAAHDLLALRCLHELARQLLPLGTCRDVARDGLLCIAGITGLGSGAVLWRPADRGAFDLLAHFGLGPQRLRQRYTLPAAAQSLLLEAGSMTTELLRRRGAGREILRALRPLEERLGDAWVVTLQGESGLRGMLLLGPSLVTQTLPPQPDWIGDLAEVLRLGLLGRRAEAEPVESLPRAVSGRSGASARAAAAPPPRSAAARLRALRRRYAVTEMLVGESAALLGMLEEIVSLAGTDYTVLVHGETGTGKEMAAQLLHRLSRRAQGPFEAVDCSAIPQELIESELFGHMKGAFTGAVRDYRGAFERADHGTLLLDEIGDMDLRIQTRLLRVLQEGSVRRVGGDRPIPVDVRVIAATHRDLGELVRQGRFREDLYYRIHVCPLYVAPLRDRGDDRLILFDHLMEKHAAELSRPARSLVPAARRLLRAQEFPGNVRQLQNVVRQLLVQRSAGGPVEPDELDRVLARAASPPHPEALAAPASDLRDVGAPRGAGPRGGPSAPIDAASWRPSGAEDPRGDALTARSRGEAVGLSGESRLGPLGEEPTLGPVVEDIGAWVLDRLRQHRFNLLGAARHLQQLRRAGAPRDVVPVFDRGALDYYLCGEFFQRLVEKRFEMGVTVSELAGTPALVPRVRRKVRAFLRPLRSLDEQDGDALRRDRYGRVPERYQLEIEQAIRALREGRWALDEAGLARRGK
jgi:transcriptional regulator with AAA-type ATPase domain